MSGLEEILQWSIDNNLATFEEVADAFDSDGRLPLDEILLDEKEEFIERLENSARPTILSQILEREPESEEPEEEEDELPEMPRNLIDRIVSSFINFFRGN